MLPCDRLSFHSAIVVIQQMQRTVGCSILKAVITSILKSSQSNALHTVH